MLKINSKEELKDFAKQYGLRPDWHEPDEESIDAKVKGKIFDNAGFWGVDFDPKPFGITPEMSVVLYHKNKPVAEINLATLFAFACDTDE